LPLSVTAAGWVHVRLAPLPRGATACDVVAHQRSKPITATKIRGDQRNNCALHLCASVARLLWTWDLGFTQGPPPACSGTRRTTTGWRT
jgi:hypothetical protein